MNHPLDVFSRSDEFQHPDFEAFSQKLGPEHPYNIEEKEVLHYYDGPVVFIGHVKGDERPRLDVLIDEKALGEEKTRVFHCVRHQLVFDSEETLRASLCEHETPTLESYRLADFVVRYETQMTRTEHPCPMHHIKTSLINPDAIPISEKPSDRVAVGTVVPTSKIKEKEE